MKLCTHCDSDMVEKNNFLGFKIPIAIVLILIPYGIFVCWLPFIIPGNYICKNCGREFRKVKEIDWREYEKMKELQKEQG
ncbi:hypothetical protein [Bacillus solimangrovi]|uniref:LITAF domain-containing protein n=1 Tax=Bacillus solimangrovi TaxID=1305675 RepID=A0A1E5LIF5_9BACI|nr:hypothetical protein [Bacillus solimangrovi]OEH93855.1 hypothetical protein BFG57_11080 [Bacillus solimangrovi]